VDRQGPYIQGTRESGPYIQGTRESGDIQATPEVVYIQGTPSLCPAPNIHGTNSARHEAFEWVRMWSWPGAAAAVAPRLATTRPGIRMARAIRSAMGLLALLLTRSNDP
jgi:hypothetical protein